MSLEYLSKYNFTQPEKDKRAAALDEVSLENGVPLHDLRAVDLVESALLHPQEGYKTPSQIEQEIALPKELIASILDNTPVISRRTLFVKQKGEHVYAHRKKPESLREAGAFIMKFISHSLYD